MAANPDRMEAPYGIIADYFDTGEVVPFLGAGASLGPRPAGAVFDGRTPAFLPTGGELSQWLASRCEFPEDPATDLAKVASYFQIRSTREDLTRSLRRVFAADYAPGAIHELLADVPKPMLIITTNYDDLIERAFRARNRPYHLVTHPEGDEYGGGNVAVWKHGVAEPLVEAPNDLTLEVTDTTIIYKMHGSVMKDEAFRKWESFVITEEDYVRFLSRMTQKSGVIPAMFMLHLRKSAFLFLGYGLRDWNLRVMLETLQQTRGRKESNRKPAWAIQYKPLPLERLLWERRDVQIFDQDLAEFAKAMRAQIKL
jgi:SIR2-like domain